MSQSYSFVGRGEVGNSLVFLVRGSVGGRGGGVGSSDILQAMQMDQSPLYASHSFGGGVGISGSGGLGGGVQMRPWRRSDWGRGWQRQGTFSSSYRPRLAVGGDAFTCFCIPV